MKILVTGGAGYIGSFVCQLLQEEGHDIVVADNLVYGQRGAVEATLESGNLLDREFLTGVMPPPAGSGHASRCLDRGRRVCPRAGQVLR